MSPTLTVLDPTGELRPAGRPRAPRPSTLDGLVVGLLDISKARGDVFLDRVEQVDGLVVGLLDISKARGDVFLDRVEQALVGRGLHVLRYRKPTFSKPAPEDLRREIAQHCQGVIEALAD